MHPIPTKNSRLVVIVGLIALFFLSIFFSVSLTVSNNKPLWLDEAYSYNADICNISTVKLITEGAPPQGSRAPLDYLTVKMFHSIRDLVKFFSLSPFQYYRLTALLAPCIVVVIIYLIAIRKDPDHLASIAFLAATAIFLFNRTILDFSSEMRPYSLWAALSFLSLVLLRYREKTKALWIISLILLAMTASTSIFQLMVLLISFSLSAILFRSRDDSAKTYLHSVYPIVIAIGVALYYIAHQTEEWHFGSGYGTFATFFHFWRLYLPMMVGGLILSILYWRRNDKDGFLSNLAIFGWIAMGPVIFFITRYKGFFFTERQYIYYWSAIAMLTFELFRFVFNSKKFQAIKNSKKHLLSIYAAIVLVFFAYVLTPVRGPLVSPRFIYQEITDNKALVPLNHEKLSKLAPANLPATFVLLGDQKKEFAPITNLKIWQDWLRIKYPPKEFPRTSELFVLVKPEGDNAQIVDIVKKDKVPSTGEKLR